MRTFLVLVAVALLIATATLQVSGISWAQDMQSSHRYSALESASFASESRAMLSTQAVTCPYEVSPVPIPSTTLEPMLHQWKTLLDQLLANRNYGSSKHLSIVFIVFYFILLCSIILFRLIDTGRRQLFCKATLSLFLTY